MPLYEYACEACGHRFEIIQKFSDAPLDACPKCGGAVRKLQSAPAFQFKGSGWYITDYARKDQGGEAKEPKESGGESKGAKETGAKGGEKAGEKGAEKAGTTDKSTSAGSPPAPAPAAPAPPSKD
jgi:putative FmdB family regulatory protein